MRTVEEIVKHKAYFELTHEERELVADLAVNEAEFNELKHLLSESSTFFAGRKVEASDEMRGHIMEKLYPPTAKSAMWYQSLGAFLFPSKKVFYQYPAFQLATVLVLFLGIITLWKSPLDKQELAQNSTVPESTEKIEKIDEITAGKTEEIASPTSRDKVISNNLKVDEQEDLGTVVNDSEMDMRDLQAPSLNEVLETEATEDYVPIITNGKNKALFLDVVEADKEAFVKDDNDDKFINNNSTLNEESNMEPLDMAPNQVTSASLEKKVERLQKRESTSSVSDMEVSSSKAFANVALEKQLNITEIQGLKGLFFEVK